VFCVKVRKQLFWSYPRVDLLKRVEVFFNSCTIDHAELEKETFEKHSVLYFDISRASSIVLEYEIIKNEKQKMQLAETLRNK